MSIVLGYILAYDGNCIDKVIHHSLQGYIFWFRNWISISAYILCFEWLYFDQM